MKYLLLFILIGLLFSCNNQDKEYQKLQSKIELLQTQLNDTYKPGFGDLMTSIQNHHAKLWFAGINDNWELASFEIHEINEALTSIKKYQADRTETKKIKMITPGIQIVEKAIEKQDLTNFKESYIQLTQTCNACHQQTNFSYNIVKVPESQTFSNQEFKIK
jgi:hypothetical protein